MITESQHQNEHSLAFKAYVQDLKSRGEIRGFSEVSKKMGFNYSSLMGVLNGRRNIPVNMWRKFLQVYELDPKKLLASYVKRQKSEEAEQCDHQNPVPVYAWESLSDPGLFDGNLEADQFFCIPGFEDCDFWLVVFGSAMAPSIPAGSVVAVRKLDDLDQVTFGEMYLIITSENRFIRRVQSGKEPGIWRLLADQEPTMEPLFGPRYEPIDLRKKHIQNIYQIKGILRRLLI